MNAAIADLQTVSAGSSYDANKQSADHSHVVVDSLRTQLKVRISRRVQGCFDSFLDRNISCVAFWPTTCTGKSTLYMGM